MKKIIKAGIIGATGYAGVELVRILLNHPSVELARVSSVSFHGKEIAEIYPGLRASCNLVLDDGHDKMLDECDVIFASLPHGHSQEIAKECVDRGIIFIDLGADFRLDNESDYEIWYEGKFINPELHREAVYGLCELNRADIKGAKLIANPGCYPTSIILALHPVLKKGLIDKKNLIIDSKSGITGAGRGLSLNTHYPESNEAFTAYKAGLHRHTPEIEQMLSKISKDRVEITFVPHLLPVNRGILSTIYCEMKTDYATIRKAFEECYKNEPFVSVLKEGEYANIKNVRLTNCCHISLHRDSHTNKLIICSAIDNMVKGAAGQAVQNMNIIFRIDETEGLSFIAPAF